jgi:hypothetical protein
MMFRKVNDDISEFKMKQKEFDEVLLRPPSLTQLEFDLRKVENQLMNERILIDMWRERERLMKLLKKEYKIYTNEGMRPQQSCFSVLTYSIDEQISARRTACTKLRR